PCGSVAYKLSLVAAGRASATWTLVPKSEWDIAAGVALLLAAGAEVRLPDGARPRFNQPVPRVTGLVASSRELYPAIERLLGLPERVD
ncbi:MAG: 3'(2'),5'-bisphosphate nucleotidase CysQ, partial [Acidobacteria bacterium]|nr:3'(2'),5'-bisphosphate nucleotidase CysQ [Acidobacteriota bacterium]